MKCSRCFFTDGTVSDHMCRKCSRNFTRAELVEVVLLGLLYLFVCRFSYYLFTGSFFAHPLSGGIFRSVRFAEVFLFPVDLSEDPWHIVTLGWVLALVLLVPMLVGRFYGVVPGMILALVGGYHVGIPFFFLLLMLSTLVWGTRVRNLLHLEVSLWIGLIPPLAYLCVLSVLAPSEELGVLAWLPWGVTVLLVAVTVSPVLRLARRRDYNARFVIWVMGLEVVVLLAIFHATVGLSRVEYEFVRRAHWAGGPHFRIVVPAPDVEHSADERRRTVRELYESRRLESLGQFTRFISWFPRSEETALALFERAELHNLRSHFTGTRPDQLGVYGDRITPEALEDYRTIRRDFSESPALSETRLRIARFALQHHQLHEAVNEYRKLVNYCDVNVPPDYHPPAGKSVLLRWRRHRLSAAEHTHLLYEVLVQARAELRFLTENTDYNGIPLMLYAQLDRYESDFPKALGEILEWFPDSRLADDVVAELKGLLDQYPNGAAAPEMLLVLGRWHLEVPMVEQAREFLNRLLREFPESPQADRARVLLDRVRDDDRKTTEG